MAQALLPIAIPHSKRREFFIVSELNDKVLDIRGADPSAGTEVLMYHMKNPPTKNQLWYLDQNGLIHSALNDMVFHNPTKGQPLGMQLASADPRSHWRLNGANIVNGSGEALDIKGASKSDGASVLAYENKNNPNQRWRFRREFVIVSEMNNRVVDIKKGVNAPGAEAVMNTKATPTPLHQLWYIDINGHVRSALNDLVLFSSEKGNELKLQPWSSDPRTHWKFEGNKLVNGAKEVLEIRGASDVDGAELCSYDYKKAKHQHWRFEYV